MNFPKFWSRGEQKGFYAWGWSNESIAQAKALGMEVAGRIAERFASGDLQRARRYEYGNRPLREEVLREFRHSQELAAVITRNSYGCLVLNTARLMFVDVDLGEPTTGGGFLGNLFGAKKSLAAHETARQTVLAVAGDWAQQNLGWGWRIYETRAGLRLMAIHRGFDSADPICETVFERLKADPLYRRLCHHQKCFRARLTPKPWRCGASPVPGRWPWDNDHALQSFQEWERRYLASAAKFSTCRLIAELGSQASAPEFHELIAAHDEVTGVMSALPLA